MADGLGRGVDRRLRGDARRSSACPRRRATAWPRPCGWPSSSGPRRITLTGPRMSDEILAFARARNVSKIVVGKPERPLWKRIAAGLDRGHARAGQRRDRRLRHQRRPGRLAADAAPRRGSAQTDWPPYALRRWPSVAICTGDRVGHVPVLRALQPDHGLPARRDRAWRRATAAGRSLLASLLSVAAFDFFFVPPYFTFAVSDTQYLVTFAVMLVVAARHQRPRRAHPRPGRVGPGARAAHGRALRDEPRAGQHARGATACSQVAVRHIAEVFRGRVVVLLPRPDGRLAPDEGAAAQFPMDTSELAVGQWVYEHGQVAGQGTDTLPGRRRRSTCRCSARAARWACSGSGRTIRAPLAGAGAAPPARDLRQPDRAGHRAGAARRGGRAGAGARRDRAAAQLAAELGLARSAHAAGLDHRRGQHPPRQRGAPRRRRPGATCWRRSTRRPTG